MRDGDGDRRRWPRRSRRSVERDAAVQAVRSKAAALVRETTGDRSFTDVNYIIPTFILTQLPIGLIGLLIVAILMAATDTIAGELNSLSTATVIDFYKRRFKPEASDAHYLAVSKVGDRRLGAVRVRGRRVGGGARLADRGGQPLRIVLLRIDPRRLHPRGRLSARHGQRRVRRADRRHGVGGVGGELTSVAFLWHNVIGAVAVVVVGLVVSAVDPAGARKADRMIFGKFIIVIVLVIVVFWLIGGLLRDRTRR